MNRRTILSGAGIVLTTPFVGCLEGQTDGTNWDGTSTGEDDTRTNANANDTDTDTEDPVRPTELERSELTTVGDLSDVPAMDEPPRITEGRGESPRASVVG